MAREPDENPLPPNALIEITENDDDDSQDSPYDELTPLIFATSNRRIRDLKSDYTNHDLDPRPSFQRGYVWDLTKASRLIESVLLNVPLPIVYTAEEQDGTELVIDGQQRLLTFFGFIDGLFPKGETPFRLRNLKILTHLNGKLFRQLDDNVQQKIKKYNINVVKIDKSSNPDVKFEIFERLNSGSVSLSSQELRNCIYRGPLNDLLKEMAEFKSFVAAMGLQQKLDRMKDVEMALRFSAFHEKTHLNYNGRMKSFLNNFMEECRQITPDRAKKLRDAFERAADLAFTVFGDKAFRRYAEARPGRPGNWEKPLNLAIFDAVMWAFSRIEKRRIIPVKDAVRARLIELMTADKDFGDSVTLATADQPKVKYRMDAFEKAVRELIDMDDTGLRAYSYEYRKKLFDTDATCKICGSRIEHLDDSEVDHILEYRNGGRTTPENARLTHRYCNRARAR